MIYEIIIIIIRLMGLKNTPSTWASIKHARHAGFFRHARHVGLKGKKRLVGLFWAWPMAWYKHNTSGLVVGPYKKGGHSPQN